MRHQAHHKFLVNVTFVSRTTNDPLKRYRSLRGWINTRHEDPVEKCQNARACHACRCVYCLFRHERKLSIHVSPVSRHTNRTKSTASTPPMRVQVRSGHKRDTPTRSCSCGSRKAETATKARVWIPPVSLRNCRRTAAAFTRNYRLSGEEHARFDATRTHRRASACVDFSDAESARKPPEARGAKHARDRSAGPWQSQQDVKLPAGVAPRGVAATCHRLPRPRRHLGAGSSNREGVRGLSGAPGVYQVTPARWLPLEHLRERQARPRAVSALDKRAWTMENSWKDIEREPMRL